MGEVEEFGSVCLCHLKGSGARCTDLLSLASMVHELW